MFCLDMKINKCGYFEQKHANPYIYHLGVGSLTIVRKKAFLVRLYMDLCIQYTVSHMFVFSDETPR